MSSVSTSGSGAPKSSFSFGRIWDQYGMLVVFAVLFIACAIFVPNFATFINMKGLGLAISMSGMVACGMLFCLASGDFDLSVASVIACAGVTTKGGFIQQQTKDNQTRDGEPDWRRQTEPVGVTKGKEAFIFDTDRFTV